MPIRRLTIHACAYGVMLACSTHTQADTSLWNGSYAAEGGCYCVGEQSRYIDSQIVPTPVGGQSIAQVCKRVGDGPTLQKINGKFNFTVYPDAQCGNGPYPELADTHNEDCIGHLGVSGEDCAFRGPQWDLADAYSRKAEIVEKIENAENTNFAKVTGGSRYIKPPVKRVAKTDEQIQPAANTSVAEIVSTRASAHKRPRRAPRVAVPESREQIRARQLVHLAAARKRAELEKLAEPVKVNPILSADSNRVSENATSVNATKESDVPNDSLVQTETVNKASIESTAGKAGSPAITKETPTTVAALKLPKELIYSDPDFNYIEAAPVNYDYGGSGLSVAASKSSHDHIQYVLKAAAAETYQEAAVGIGMFFTPSEAQHTTMMVRAGLEYGSLDFQNGAVKATHSDTGMFAAISTRVAFSRKFELQAGVSYSSFFEGDVIGFGAAFYHLTQKLDLTAKTEIGDNDLIGFGIRYHY